MSKKEGTYFNRNELYNILGIEENSNINILLPNEIFDNLVKCTEFKPKVSKIKGRKNTVVTYEKNANANHLAFAFSYVYLTSYLYRYARFSFHINYYDTKIIDEKMLYKILNTSPSSRGKNGVSYITKRGGLLEKLGYIRKDNDYPVNFKYERDKYTNEIIDYTPYFVMYSDLKENEEIASSIRREITNVNFPVKGFFSNEESEKNECFDGYFYEPMYCTKINTKIFVYCMSKKELGTLGFYLYCFLKSKTDYFGTSYIRSVDDLTSDTGIGKTKLVEMLKKLEEYNMITNSHNHFVPNLPQGKKLPANSYSTNEYQNFLKYGKQTAGKRRVMSYETYDKEIGEYLSTEINSDVGETQDEVKVDLPKNM
ncbi:hypothetical protein [Metabacillus fastidiosus]|uniref:hypothetical protein n=1 Tax=Metabacillus fastidiosus TaxID=1458 RepID=UPI003D2E7E52